MTFKKLSTNEKKHKCPFYQPHIGTCSEHKILCCNRCIKGENLK